jgi:hypothetical protein
MMHTLLVPVGLLTAYGCGYYALFIGTPAVLGRTASGLVSHARRKFPNSTGRDAMQMFLVTRFGIGAGIVGVGSIIASLIGR